MSERRKRKKDKSVRNANVVQSTRIVQAEKYPADRFNFQLSVKDRFQNAIHSSNYGAVVSWTLVVLLCAFIGETAHISPKRIWSYKNMEDGTIYNAVQTLFIKNGTIHRVPKNYRDTVGDKPLFSIESTDDVQGVALPLGAVVPDGVKSLTFAFSWFASKEGSLHVRRMNIFENGNMEFSKYDHPITIYPHYVNKHLTISKTFDDWKESPYNYLFLGSFREPCHVFIENISFYDSTSFNQFTRK